MSPEQAAGLNNQMDVRSDVFLLGATLYHMFAFFPPYLGTTVSQVLDSARGCEYLRPEQLQFGDMDIPAEVCRIMARAMAPRPDDRYQDVAELIEDLDALLHGRMNTVKRAFPEGEHLMHEGEIGTECYIITDGTVEIYKSNGHDRVVLGRQSKGDIVGEMALITHEPRSASIVALEDTEVLVLNAKLFDVNLQRLPPWMSKTVQTLAYRLSRTDIVLAEQHHRLHALELETDAEREDMEATS
jgi:serine/threonine-protein kinase